MPSKKHTDERVPPRKLYKGLGVGGFCLPEPSLADKVTHGEMQAELSRLRAAITLLASRLGNELGSHDSRRILELLNPEMAATPDDRP